jgi:hypothetical protein
LHFSRKISRRKVIEVVICYSNESNFSAAEKNWLRLKNLLAVPGGFSSRNSAAEIRVSPDSRTKQFSDTAIRAKMHIDTHPHEKCNQGHHKGLQTPA